MENEIKRDHIQLDNLVTGMPISDHLKTYDALKSEINNIDKDMPNILEKSIISYMQKIKLNSPTEETLEQIRFLREKKDLEMIDKTNERIARMDEADLIEKRCNTARQNIAALLGLRACALVGVTSDIDKEIDKNIANMAVSYEDTVCDKDMGIFDTDEDRIISFCKGLKKSLSKTNIYDVMKKAKESGYEMKISDTDIELYRDGKNIFELKDDFLKSDSDEIQKI